MSSLVGYTRELIDGTEVSRDVAELEQAGVAKVFVDSASADPRRRPALAECLASLTDGDVLVVTSSERLAHGLAHFVATVASLTERRVGFRSLAEPALSSDFDQSVRPAEVLRALERLQRRLRSVGTRAGMMTAAADGRRAGRPTVMTQERIDIARELRNHDRSFSHIARVLGVSTSAVQRALSTQAPTR